MPDEEDVAAVESPWWAAGPFDAPAPTSPPMAPPAAPADAVLWPEPIRWPSTVPAELGLPEYPGPAGADADPFDLVSDLFPPPAPEADPWADRRRDGLPAPMPADPEVTAYFAEAPDPGGLDAADEAWPVFDDADGTVMSFDDFAPAAAGGGAFFGEPAGGPGGGRGGGSRRRVNLTVVGVVAFAGLLLVGLVLSIRNGPDGSSSNASSSGRAADNISTQGKLATTEVATTTTTSPPTTLPGIALGNLVPADAGAPSGTAAGSGTGAPAPRSSGQPTTAQTTSTTAAPTGTDAPPAPGPTDSVPDTTQAPVPTTRPPSTNFTFTVPSFTIPTVDLPGTSRPRNLRTPFSSGN